MIIKNPLKGNRMVGPKRLLEMGLVDRIMNSDDFLNQVIGFLEEIVSGRGKQIKRAADPWMSMELYEQTYDFVFKTSSFRSKSTLWGT